MKFQLLALFFLGFNLTYSQLYILHYGAPNDRDPCAIMESNYYLSNGIVIEPIDGVGDYLFFDKYPTYLEYVTRADTDFSCAWRSVSTYNDHINININDCNWVISNQVLLQPNASNNSFCDKISLASVGCTGTQRFFWEYSTDGVNYIKTNLSTGFNENYEFIKSNFLPNNYLGNIFFRVLIDSDPYLTEENIYSNIVPYNITSCSPLLDGSPIVSTTKCKNEANGSVILKFQTNINTNQQLLLNLFEGTIFRQHKFAPYTDIINNEFPWKDLAEGTYTIKYQAQSYTDMNTTVGSSPVITPSFQIKSPELLKFTPTPIQPLCSTDKGSIEITVIGGTAPYYYILDNAKENINGQDVPKKTSISVPIQGLTEGYHNIKVVDSNGCIQAQE